MTRRERPIAATLSGLLILVSAGSTALAKPPKDSWNVTRVSDPITGASSCVVAAADQFNRFAYTRSGYLYPIVENNSRFGLLVGVSTGGAFRFPSGDILWKVDDKPFRELKVVDNPVVNPPTFAIPMPANVTPEMKATVDATMRMAATAGSTSTLASGAKAKEMLAEMIAGTSLIYRAATASPAYGLPSQGTNRVGQITSEGQRPIPIDDSFRAGLIKCGIGLGGEPTR